MTDLTTASPPADPAVPVTPAVAPSPLLSRPGAVAAEGIDAGIAWHYGDPVAEQRRLEAGRGQVDLSNRGVITISGADRRSWLHSMTTQMLTDLAPHTSAETLILSPKGHIEHDLHLVDDGSTIWITVEPGTAGDVVAWLKRMQFMLRVEVTDVSADWAVIGQPIAAESAPGEPIAWKDPWPEPVAGGTLYTSAEVEAEHPAWAWREVLLPRAEFETRVAAGEFDDSAGTWALDALRVAAWRPRLAFETDHRTIPHELDWLRTAVHLQKGCYRGQETVARVHNLGRPPRRLVMLHLDGSEHVLPPAGAEVKLGDRVIGRITTAARHHELGPVALAVVKRSTPPTEPLTVEGIAAAQETVVQP